VIRDSSLSKKAIEKRLRTIKKKRGGRNAQGKITVRHQGGGAKRFIRLVDFKRDKYDIPARVAALEYDPNRNARLALLHYADGEKRYIIAPQHLTVGTTIVASQKQAEIKVGNQLKLKYIPTGLEVHNVELTPGRGGQICRSAGNYAILNSVDTGRALLKMPSGEVRVVSEECSATIGMVSNPEFRNIRWGKAGRMRHRGIRPSVRGKVMNPVDHPHGGGEGKHPIGMKHPKTYTGKIALGVKTRKPKKYSDSLIIKRRKGRTL
jgi:large subunit ribosomal protein L2